MHRSLASLALSIAVLGCDTGNDSKGPDDEGDGDGGGGADAAPVDEGPTYFTVTGTMVDFETGEPLAIDPGLATEGLAPEPSVTLEGADFTLSNVIENSVFHLIATAPEHIPTVAATVTVAEENVSGVIAYVVSEAYVAALADAFGVELGTDGLVLARAVDDAGEPVAGVPAEAFELAQENPVAGPFFLDEALDPAPDLEETSASGWVVFFQVQPGLAAITAKVDSGYLMDMAATPIDASAATVAQVLVTAGEAPELPANISFTGDIVPIFGARGCADCHSGNGPGKDIAGLALSGGDNKIYNELMEPASNPGTRVDIATPENSLVLSMPSAEDPPDGHPTVVFASPTDEDYVKLMVWISEGALNN